MAMIVIALAAPLLTACGDDDDQPAATPTQEPDASGVVVTFRVVDEEYRIRLTDPDDIAIARTLHDGGEAPSIPNGVVVRGEPDVNTGYSWHIDPATVEFADATIEVCDGRPSDVESGVITSDRYCPWEAQVIDIAE
jgi:hypothetical protein